MHTTQRQVQAHCRVCCAAPARFEGPSGARIRPMCGVAVPRASCTLLLAVRRQPHDARCAWALGRSVSTDACDAETGAGHAARHLYEAGVYLPGRAAGLRAAKTRPPPPSGAWQKPPYVRASCWVLNFQKIQSQTKKRISRAFCNLKCHQAALTTVKNARVTEGSPQMPVFF